jgi:chromosome segregation ATPase
MQSVDANRTLSSKLLMIEPVVLDLEAALEESKARLMHEQRLRQQAEIYCLEAENRYQKAEKTIHSLRDDISSNRSLGSARRSHLKSAVVSTHLDDDSYVEILDELENVTEQLIETQRQLYDTEDLLERERTKARQLERNQDDMELMKEELTLAHEEIRDAEEEKDSVQEFKKHALRVELLENMLREQKVKFELSQQELKKCTEDLKEANEENAKHDEELSCLRNALHEAIEGKEDKETSPGVEVTIHEPPGNTEAEMREAITKEVRVSVLKENKAEREKEINVLREKFKTLFKENALLQTKVSSCEQAVIQTRALKEEVPKLKEEIAMLKLASTTANREVDSSTEKQILETINNENDALKQKVDDIEKSFNLSKTEAGKNLSQLKTCQGSLQASREEILKLKAMMHQLNDSLEDSHGTTEEYRKALKESQLEVSCVNEELKESRELCETLAENARLSQQENSRLQDRLHSLNSALDESEREYSDILRQLNMLKDLHANSRQVPEDKRMTPNGQDRDASNTLEALKTSNNSESPSSHCRDKRVDKRKLEMLQDENGSLKMMLHEAEAAVATLNDELGNARTHIASLNVDLVEYEAKLKNPESRGKSIGDELDRKRESHEGRDIETMTFDRGGFDQKHSESHEGRDPEPTTVDGEALPSDTSGLISSDHQSMLDEELTREPAGARGGLYSWPLLMLDESEHDVEEMGKGVDSRTDGNPSSAFQFPPKTAKDDSREVKKLKLSLLVSKDEAAILKSQVEMLTTALDHRFGEHAEEMENLRRRMDRNPDKYVEESFQEEVPDQDRKDFFRALLEENSFLQEKMEATEKSLNDMEDRHKLKEEMLKMYEVGFASYEERLNRSADEAFQLREEIANLKKEIEIAESTSQGNASSVKALQAMLNTTDESLKEMQKQMNDSKMSQVESEAQKAALEKEVADLKTSLSEARQCHDNILEELKSFKVQCDELRKSATSLETERLKELRSQMMAERENELKTLRNQLETVVGEKSALQHQVDDAKIAMSVSQYAQEKSKEELRGCEAQLELSKEEAFLLRNEAAKSNTALMRARKDYAIAIEELQSTRSQLDDAWRQPHKSMDEIDELEDKLEEVSRKNSELESQVEGLAKALSASKRELEVKLQELELSESQVRSKNEKLVAMENSLLSSREETRLLTEEISHLSLALENAKIEYDAVVDELEAVDELFNEARKDAEMYGRQAATEEIRREAKVSIEHERKQMKDQFKKLLEDNDIVRTKLDEAEMALVVARHVDESDSDVAMKRLQDAARLSEAETRNLKEKLFSLSSDLKGAKRDAEVARDELDATNRLLEETLVMSERTESSDSFLPKEKSMLREQIRNLIAEHSGVKAPSQADAKVMDLCVALEKSLSENAAFRQELDKIRLTIEKARAEGEKRGAITATKQVRAEVQLDRVREMNDLKQHLTEESVILRQKADDAEAAMASSKESECRIRAELNKLAEALMASKLEARKFQHDSLKLTTELETTNIEHSRAVQEMRADVQTNIDSKVKALSHQLHGLTIENGTLLRKLRSTKEALDSTRNLMMRNKEEMDARYQSLQTSQKVTFGLQDEIASLRRELEKTKMDYKMALESLPEDLSILDSKSKDVETDLASLKSAMESKAFQVQELSNKLFASDEEVKNLKDQVLKLTKLLQKSTDDLKFLSHRSKVTCDEDTNEIFALQSKQNQLLEEKGSLEQQMSESNMIMSQSKKALSDCLTELQASKLEVATLQEELEQRSTELLDATTKELSSMVEDAMDALQDPTAPERGELNKLKERLETLSIEKLRLERKARDVEGALLLSKENEKKQRMDIAECEDKLKTWKKETLHLRGEVAKLRSALGNANEGHVYLRDQLETVNRQVLLLCTEAEARGRAAAMEEISADFVCGNDQEMQKTAGQLGTLNVADETRVPRDVEVMNTRIESGYTGPLTYGGQKIDLGKTMSESTTAEALQAHFDRTTDNIAKIDKEIEDLARLEKSCISPRANQNKSNFEELWKVSETGLAFRKKSKTTEALEEPKEYTFDGLSDKAGKSVRQSETRDDVNMGPPQDDVNKETSRSSSQLSQETEDPDTDSMSPATAWESKAEAKKKKWKEKLEVSRSRRKGKSKQSQDEIAQEVASAGTDSVVEPSQGNRAEIEGRE